MPKRTDINSILIIGAGPIIIGQACEFDYSGTQACKALKEEGYRVILVNSNPATIMTDPDLADVTYIEPITPDIVARIIAKERPDALLPTMGGQTALNTALSLKRMGVLDKYNVEMIGANALAIDKAEDRALFRKAMKKIGLDTPKSMLANATEIKETDRKEYEDKRNQLLNSLSGTQLEQSLTKLQENWTKTEGERKNRYMSYAMGLASKALDEIGLPAIIRPSFTLGGTGGGIAYNRSQFYEIVEQGLDASPTTEVLIEESIVGWKEFEMEVVRDKSDNSIIICSIENLDPMGVHTGDSITVAPALTLTDKEYQQMRNASIAVLREIGVETGGANVQFAVNPVNGRMIVIEMNPRVSRSSALASKATGFPIAKIAAKLAVGYRLDELKNDITGGSTPASFEPSIDYIVTKIPRFAFEKFPNSDPLLGTSMKAVGETMAIGRNFKESLQKALRSLETGLTGFDEINIPDVEEENYKDALRAAVAHPTPNRLRFIAQAIREKMPLEEIHKLSHIDPWFLNHIAEIIEIEEKIKQHGLPQDHQNLNMLKSLGFSDSRLATLANCQEKQVKALRKKLNVTPIFKRIDTCAAEFYSPTAYIYSTYEKSGIEEYSCEALVSDRKKVVILGGGPNRIGQGIEFDYCCCHASFALQEMDIEAIMINCNPETVSTDYDTSDRLYFEPLTAEDVLAILEKEQEKGQLLGVIVQFGGQTPLKLAQSLQESGISILGTSPEAINLAEDRDQFKKLLQELNLTQPSNGIAYSIEDSFKLAQNIKFPVVVRPSYVLGGRAMRIIRDPKELESYMNNLVIELVSEDIKALFPYDSTKQIDYFLSKNPLLFDRYLSKAIEVDVDCLCDGENTYISGIMEHIEEAGIHSGDSAASLPTHSLTNDIILKLEEQTKKLSKALNVGGLMNIQFAISDNKIYILEVNPRASRTVPFVAKTIGKPIAKIAARIMTGQTLEQAFTAYGGSEIKYRKKPIAIKEAVFPFSRFPNEDILLGPEMRSTGEVMGLDEDFGLAFAKAQLAAGFELPLEGNIFISVRDEDKEEIIDSVQILQNLGYNILATGGTHVFLAQHNINSKKINKVLEGHPHIEDAIRNRKIQMVINTSNSHNRPSDSKSLRRATIANRIPYFTTATGTKAAIQAMKSLKTKELRVSSLQSYFIN